MDKFPAIYLKPGKEEPFRRFHPWIFSGAIGRTKGEIEEGDIVEVFSSEGNYLATGHALRSSIVVKIFSFVKTKADQNFWTKKIKEAYRYRQSLGYASSSGADSFRLVYGEGDGLPGLIIDIYGKLAVIQCHSVGMHLAVPMLTEALKSTLGKSLETVFEKSADVLSDSSSYEVTDGYRLGDDSVKTIQVEGLDYHFDLQGQKTGFFLDQRENRKAVEQASAGKKVLDVFCYSGGFTLHALRGGASHVHAVDSSAKAIDLVKSNVMLNNFDQARFSSTVADAKQFLLSPEGAYDVIILDPPAFAKHHDMKNKGLRGYININRQAIQQISQGGLLFTFSCSQAVDKKAFQSAVTAAAIEAGRPVKIIRQFGQSPDHPVNLYHPEGEYLKGLLLYVD